jgi:vitamin B12 transporter
LHQPSCFFLLASLASLPAVTVGAELCGRVLDPSGAVVPAASVTVTARANPASVKTVSGPRGEFCVSGLAPGAYLAEAAAAGFSPSAAVEVQLDGHDQTPLDLRLALAQVTSRISVTATGSAQTSDEIQKAFDIVDRREIERRAEFSLAEALRLAPGLRVMQNGGPGALTSIHIRGMRSFDTSILVDGFRFRDAAAPQGEGGGFLEELFLVDTERLEVLRGSGSSLYGTHAVGGVLNVVTDPGGGPFRGEVEAEGGGLGLARGAARFSGSARRERLLFSGGVAHLNVTRGIDGDDRTRNTSGHGFAQYRFGDNSRLSARLFAGDSFLQLNDSPFAVPASNLPPAGVVPAIALPRAEVRRLEAGLPFSFGNATFVPSADDPDDRRASGFYNGMAAFTQQFGPRISFRAAYQGLATRRTSRDGPAGHSFEPAFNSAFAFDGRIDLAEGRTDIQAGAHHFVSAGYEFERENYDTLAADENPDPVQRTRALAEAAQHSHAVFAQDQMRWLGDRLLISLSGRLQSFRLRQPRFSGGPPAYSGLRLEAPPTAYTGDAAVAYLFPSSGTKLRAHFGNGYRAPSLFERLGASFFFGFFSPFGDPRLRPERSLAVDAGFDRYLAANRLRLSATWFYTRLQEVIVFDFSGAIDPATDPYGRFGGYRNTGGGLARGAEVSLEASPAPSLRLKSAYTFTNAQERVSSTVDGSLRSFNIPRHMFTLLVTQRIRRPLEVTFDLMAASSYHFPLFTDAGSRAFRFDGPFKGDVVVSYSWPLSDQRHLRLFTRIENVFNRTYYEGGFYTPGAWAVAGLKFHF